MVISIIVGALLLACIVGLFWAEELVQEDPLCYDEDTEDQDLDEESV